MATGEEEGLHFTLTLPPRNVAAMANGIVAIVARRGVALWRRVASSAVFNVSAVCIVWRIVAVMPNAARRRGGVAAWRIVWRLCGVCVARKQ